MQTDKIDIERGTVYAVKHQGGLARFRPTAINKRWTSRRGNAVTVLEGYFIAADLDQDHMPLDSRTIVKLEPAQLLGEYSQYVELERQQAEARAATQAATQARKQAAVDLRLKLYAMIGQEAPLNAEASSQPFVIRYSGESVHIEQDGVVKLLDALKQAEYANFRDRVTA
jgi:hypothetical protein